MTMVSETKRLDDVVVGHGVLVVLDGMGDRRLTWDHADTSTATEARAEFDRVIREGYMAYSVVDTAGGEVLRSFDETAEKIVMAPATRGG